jgi:hypothetical protein
MAPHLQAEGQVDSILGPSDVLRVAEIPVRASDPVKRLAKELGDGQFALITFFVSAKADFSAIVKQAQALYPDTDVLACTTAGEIGKNGYSDGTILAIGFPAGAFASKSMLLRDIANLDTQVVLDQIALNRVGLVNAAPDLEDGFSFLLVDGLSLSEDTLAASLAAGLRDFPLFGGSAGDGTRFEQTLLSLNGEITSGAAILTLIRSRYRTEVFSLNNMVPGETKMVVTQADPMRRIVKSINAEPAAREYARLVGKDPEQLDRFTFASHPVVVHIGESYHVRAIQQVTDAGELVFFSAIDEGMVLTIAQQSNLAEHLQNTLIQLCASGATRQILGCDCILRRIEAERSQQTRQVSNVLRQFRVTGFSTYGEQIGPLHVNQTMTGVAFYDRFTAVPTEPTCRS